MTQRQTNLNALFTCQELGALPWISLSWRKATAAGAGLRGVISTGDSLGVTAAPRITSGTCQPICGYSASDFGSFAALCISLWKHSALVVWHFNCFHLELSHEFLIRKTLLGRGVERQNQGPEWPWDWKMREKWQSLCESWELYQREPREIMKIGNIVRRDSLCGSHCSLTLSWLKQTGENLSLPAPVCGQIWEMMLKAAEVEQSFVWEVC